MSLRPEESIDAGQRWKLECFDWPSPGWCAVAYASDPRRAARLASSFVQNPDARAVRLVDRKAKPTTKKSGTAVKAFFHRGECQADPFAREVCEGMYGDKCDDVAKLQEALRAVYALAGESPEIAEIVHSAIRETGGED